MNDGFGCGCIVLNYGKLIGRIDEHGDSQIDFCGRPTFQRVSDKPSLLLICLMDNFKQSYPTLAILQLLSLHQHRGSQGKPWLRGGLCVTRCANGVVLRTFSRDLSLAQWNSRGSFMNPFHAKPAKKNPKLERALPVETDEQNIQISGKLITFTSPLRRKVTLCTPSQAKPGVETCSAETPWPSLAASCLKWCIQQREPTSWG